MVQETTRAVSIIVEVANALCHPHKNDTEQRPMLPRSVSYLAMPPPPPIIRNRVQQPHQDGRTTTKHNHQPSPFYRRSILDGTSHDITTTNNDTTGLDLLCSAVVSDGDVPVVSPQISKIPSPDHNITMDLTLDDGRAPADHQNTMDDDEDVSRLSLDQCADIVDVCLFGDSFHTNHYDLDCRTSSSLPSPSKRIKIEE
jgi:hypothetical protein